MHKRKSVIGSDSIDDFESYREQARRIKQHTIDNLDFYLEQLERNVIKNGGKVIWARDADEAVAFVRNLCKEKGVKRIVKSKSMTTEEIELNHELERDNIDVVETDLGEYILQLAREKPYHIVAPALHKTRYDVADIYREARRRARRVIEKRMMIARRVCARNSLRLNSASPAPTS